MLGINSRNKPHMNADGRRWNAFYPRASAFICGSLFLSAFSLGQTGLDAINDDALMNELASRGLTTLLDRAFEVNRVPETERQARRAMIGLARLADPNAKLTTAQRQQLVAEAVSGIESALPTINDPDLLLRQAWTLIRQSIQRDASTLEYWGPNPRASAILRPTVLAAMKMLDRSAELSKKQADELANRITTPGGPMVDRYMALQQLTTKAEYNKWMWLAYELAMASDPVSPERKRLAIEGTEYLKQYDVSANPDRGMVRNRMAKLAMASADFEPARQYFGSTLSDTAAPAISIDQKYEAKYFLAVVELLARNLPGAQNGLQELIAFSQANPISDKDSRAGIEAAVAALEYRIHCLESELAKSPAEKKKAEEAGTTVLMDLLARRPDLRAIVYDQLLPKLDERQDLKQLEPLLLRAIVSRGEQELQKPRTGQPDTKVLTTAIEAAKELAARLNKPGVDSATVDASSLLIPFFMDSLGRRAEAANAFVDYAQQYKTSNPTNATLALNNAQAIIGELRSTAQGRADANITRAYERFLPTAIGEPFNRREFAYEYAARLQLNGQIADAVKYYQLVPADDSRAAEARFLQLLALKQQLDGTSLSPAERTTTLTQIQTLADQVNAASRASLAAAKTDAERTSAQSRLARTSLLAADLARREQKDPQRAIQLLTGFEQSAAALPNGKDLLDNAIYLRVLAYMGLEKYSEATQELVSLLSRSSGAHGADVVRDLLEKLNSDFDRAQQANDRVTMKSLAKNRAQLSGFLVKWAQESKDPAIQKFTYRYRVFDAETQRRAAEQEDEQSARQAGMKLALERYQALQSAEGVALYNTSLDPKPTEPATYDPQVTLGVALIQYDMGNYSEAATGLSQLVAQRKLGIDTDQSWEAAAKLIRANLKLNRNVEESKNYLKMQYIAFGPGLGKKWKPEFEALRKELIPDFKVEDLNAPATQP